MEFSGESSETFIFLSVVTTESLFAILDSIIGGITFFLSVSISPDIG